MVKFVKLCRVCDFKFTDDMAGMVKFNKKCGINEHLGELKNE